MILMQLIIVQKISLHICLIILFSCVSECSSIKSLSSQQYCPSYIISQLYNVKNDRTFQNNMVSSRKVLSFTRRNQKRIVRRTQNIANIKSKNKIRRRESYERRKNPESVQKPPKNDLLDQFGIDLGDAGQELYDWLWPKNPNMTKRRREFLATLDINKVLVDNRGALVTPVTTGCIYNKNIHRYLTHNFSSEEFVEIYRKIAFHMRITPRILVREVGALTGQFGMNILTPEEDEYGQSIRADILCLRRIKFKVYTLLGLKLLRYTLLFLLRYIRLGIPPEIRLRYLSDVFKHGNTMRAFDMVCNQIDYENDLDNPLKQTYPERIDFKSQGYPYSDALFYEPSEPNPDLHWSPSKLVDPRVVPHLNKTTKAKIVFMAAALYPKYALQIVKNVAHAAGYKNERELLTLFCLNNDFKSRGAKSFVSRLKEEHISDMLLRRAAKLYSGSDELPESQAAALDTLVAIPYLSGLINRHLGSGRKTMPVNRARTIYKKIRHEVDLPKGEMLLWDILRELISRRVLSAPLHIYKQVRMEMFSARTYLSPNLKQELEKKSIDTTDLYNDTNGLPEDVLSLPREEKKLLAKTIKSNLKKIWLNLSSTETELEDVGITILDAMAAAAGYKDLNNVLVIVTMLSRPVVGKIEKRIRQPGPEFEHSPNLEFKDFKNKIV